MIAFTGEMVVHAMPEVADYATLVYLGFLSSEVSLSPNIQRSADLVIFCREKID